MASQGGRPRWRAYLVIVLFSLWAAAVAARLFQLQVQKHDFYAKQADLRAVRRMKLKPLRGAIFDRNGRPLAVSAPVHKVVLDPKLVPDPAVAAGILAPVLEMDQAALEKRVSDAKRAGERYIEVQRRVNFEQSERLRKLRLGWIHLVPESMRIYPQGAMASHVLGGVDSEGQGNAGIEQALNRELTGLPGEARVIRDAAQRTVTTKVEKEPVPGTDIVLTIDERIQQVAEEELAKAVAERGGVSGSVVVMNPENGEILALASYPSYDPNQPVRSKKELEARMNHAVSVPFEPGSVFKVVTMAAALETTSLRPETVVPCGNGSINLFGRVIRDHKAYSSLSMADVLAKSSNIGTIQIGLKVGAKNLLDYVRRFGFGRVTGLPLPAESAGKVRDLPAWGRTSIGSVAMGHEVSATTVQLARAISVFANGGRLVRPKLIAARRRPGAGLESEPDTPSVPVLRPETAITMRQMMEGVVLHGTGTLARLSGYTAAGKTGSAQIYDPSCRCYRHDYNASFAGFAPVTRPAVVVVATINGAPVFGGAIAAPVFREVASTALRLMSVPRDLPDAPPPREEAPAAYSDLALAELSPPSFSLPQTEGSAEPAALELLGPRAPDFYGKSVRRVLEESTQLGLTVEVVGSGLARAQWPPPGEIVPAGGRVRVQFAR